MRARFPSPARAEWVPYSSMFWRGRPDPIRSNFIVREEISSHVITLPGPLPLATLTATPDIARAHTQTQPLPLRDRMIPRPTRARQSAAERQASLASHGARCWIDPDSRSSIKEDFGKMAEKGRHWIFVRLALWGIAPDLRWISQVLMSFFAAAGNQITAALPQIPGWVNGRSNNSAGVRRAFKDHIVKIINHFKNKPAPVDHGHRAFPFLENQANRDDAESPATGSKRYASEDELRGLTGMTAFAAAYPVNDASKGSWNNYQPFNDWLTFTCYAVAEAESLVCASRRPMPLHRSVPRRLTFCTIRLWKTA